MFGQTSSKRLGSCSEDSPVVSQTVSSDQLCSEQITQSFPYKIPTPPSSRPSSSRPSSSRRIRCKSLRGNLRQIAKQRTSSEPDLADNDCDFNDNNLKKYKPLPAIGSQEQIKNNIERVSKRKESGVELSNITARSEEQLDIAVKLLDGTRHEHCFGSCSTFHDVVQYMRSVASADAVPSHCEFVTCEFPRQVFSDLSVSLSEANIKTRTLLYLRETDPD